MRDIYLSSYLSIQMRSINLASYLYKWEQQYQYGSIRRNSKYRGFTWDRDWRPKKDIASGLQSTRVRADIILHSAGITGISIGWVGLRVRDFPRNRARVILIRAQSIHVREKWECFQRGTPNTGEGEVNCLASNAESKREWQRRLRQPPASLEGGIKLFHESALRNLKGRPRRGEGTEHLCACRKHKE